MKHPHISKTRLQIECNHIKLEFPTLNNDFITSHLVYQPISDIIEIERNLLSIQIRALADGSK